MRSSRTWQSFATSSAARAPPGRAGRAETASRSIALMTPHADAWKLPDGTPVDIRPILPEDETPLGAVYRNRSDEKLRPPGFGAIKAQPRECFAKLCQLDSDQDVGFVAESKGARGAPKLLGVCRWFFHPETNSAELGLEVIKAWQGKGLSHLLIRHMVAAARKRGIRRLITGAQAPMIGIVTGYGFTMNGEIVDASDGTFKVIRNLETGIDFSKYDPANISKADIKFLVSSMYQPANWKEEIKDFFLDVDPAQAVQCLDELFHGSDPDIRSNAVEMLVFLEGSKALPWIEECLNDDDVGFRCAGCSFLAEVDSPETIPRLVRCLREDPSDWVRYAAVEALERCGDKSALPALRQAAKSDQGTDHEGRPIRDAAREAIKQITARNR